MQAIILAAGLGKRLGEYTKSNTKCMVKVNGRALIDRALDQLSSLNIKRVVIVVGYEGQKLIDHVGSDWNGLPVEYIVNPIYDKTNNIYSLALAKCQMMEDDTLLMESDIIFENGLLEMVMNSQYQNLALVAKYESWMDGTMVQIDDENNIVNFIPKSAFHYGEISSYYKTLNIYKFSREFSANKYIPFLEAYTKSVGMNEYYENVLRILSYLNSRELKALPISDEKWYEIDDKQDLDIADTIFSDADDLVQNYHSRYGGFWRFPKMLDFCYLVNPYFCSSRIVDEMEANFRTLLGEYPSGLRVNSLLASKCWGIKEDYVVPGNGASELIKALLDQIHGLFGVVRPTFEEYPNRVPENRLVTFIPNNRDYRYTVEDLMCFFGDSQIESLLLINPDNPSGNYIRVDDVLRLAEWCETEDIRLIVDESFVDFCDDWETASLLSNSILEKYHSMVVIKSISKSYGVPGLRLGIAASGDTSLISQIKKDSSIWNINSFAEFFMQIFNKYEKDYTLSCRRFIETRNIFIEQLKKITYLHVIPSQANFVLCEVLEPHSASILSLHLLKDYNILISECGVKKGLAKNRYVRLAIRSIEENAKLISALSSISF